MSVVAPKERVKRKEHIVEKRGLILFNDDVKEKEFTDNSKWGAYPTTRQGDENLEKSNDCCCTMPCWISLNF
jgi:hypothetical protein